MKKIIIIILMITISFLPHRVYSANNYTTDLEADNSQWWSRADDVALSCTGDMTGLAWVKRESDINSHPMSKDESVGNQRSWDFRFEGGATMVYVMSACDASGISSASYGHVPDVGVWENVGFRYDASEGTTDFFVNGSQVHGVGGQVNSIADCTADFRIGAGRGAASPFDGQIDSVRLWCDYISSTTISEYYNCRGAEGTEAGYWEFENNGTDDSGNGFTLTNNNVATFQSGSLPFTTECNAPPVHIDATSTMRILSHVKIL